MHQRRTNLPSAFTLIEMLMVIVIIVILVGVLVVATSAARTAAKRAETKSRMTAMAQGMTAFKNDIGYYPPILNDSRGLANFPNFPPIGMQGNEQVSYRGTAQNWYSITSPAEYLLGYGGRDEDGYGSYRDLGGPIQNREESPALGIRHPAMDGVWGATDRCAFPDFDCDRGTWDFDDRGYAIAAGGKTYGPYIEVENEQMLGRIVLGPDRDGDGARDATLDPLTGQPIVLYPGDPDYSTNNKDNPMVLVDSWGSPIRYYRQVYPFKNQFPQTDEVDREIESGLSRIYPPNSDFARPTLSDYIVLRPFNLPKSSVNASFGDYNEAYGNGDPSTTLELQTGNIAFFSAGADKQLNNRIRADVFGLPGNEDDDATDEFNADNIVEIGP
ncbi:MAG: prepilin-type N-terminal cleavage/methylation domain-containing protein [Phycisphaerae bacterium]|nr:prepilin-type N-terminal cleavage/methylation domain-containing protein [Phycisphaerae bacterium]